MNRMASSRSPARRSLQPALKEGEYSLWGDRIASHSMNSSKGNIAIDDHREKEVEDGLSRQTGRFGDNPISMSGVAREAGEKIVPNDRKRAVMHDLLQKRMSLREELERGLMSESNQPTDISSISNQDAGNNTFSRSWIDTLARNTKIHEEYIGERFDTEPSIAQSNETRSITSNGEEFFRRVTDWQKQKEKESEMKRRMQENQKLADCTFRPHIERKRSNSTEVPISERLYKDHEERLRQLQYRQHIRMQDMDLDCTFRPHIESKRLVTESRYKTPQHLRMSIKEPEPSTEDKNLSECTFTPKILQKSTKSGTLEQYLSKNPFERLSTSTSKKITNLSQAKEVKSPSPKKVEVGGEKCFDDDSLYRPLSSMYISQTDMERMERDQRDSEATNQLRREAFENFLRRQAEHSERAKQKIDRIQRNVQEETGRPSICDRSRKMAEEKGDFSSRLEDYLRRRKDYENERKHGTASTNEPRFKPQITNMGKKMPSRNPEDRSLGDYYRLEVARESAKIHVEAERKAETTFKPSINTSTKTHFSRSRNASSALNIRADPDGYIERLRAKEKMQQQEKKRIRERKEREEMAKCTFNPETHSAPLYVQRIARSMTQMRSTSPVAPTPGDLIPWRN